MKFDYYIDTMRFSIRRKIAVSVLSEIEKAKALIFLDKIKMRDNPQVKKKYYKSLEIIRIFSCFAVLLYHLDILKGGYLAVCSFFTLSGYLSCITNFNKKKFSLLNYYKNRFIKIYIPIVITIFTTIFATSFLKEIKIINLREEVVSILLGYNNFWQLHANLDYFSAHIRSPFTHFWYMSILLQFELIFPLILIGLKKIAARTNEDIPIIATIAVGTVSAFFFYILCFTSNVMSAYYNTFSHAFSWLFGIALGFSHCCDKNLMPIKFNNQKVLRIIFSFYLIVLLGIFIFVSGESELFAIGLLVTTIFTASLIDYGALIKNPEGKFSKTLAALSYEIYLTQYPIIFVCEHISIFERFHLLKFFSIVALTILFSFFIHFGLNKNASKKAFSISAKILLFAMTAAGIYKFFTAQDFAAQMDALEKEIQENQILLEQKKVEFYGSENSQGAETSHENGAGLFPEAESQGEEFVQDENLDAQIANMPIAAFGDSIMLGASTSLYDFFPNIYIDAKVSRAVWSVLELIQDLLLQKKLGAPVVIHLGSNGDSSEKTKDTIMDLLEGREVFWLTVTNDKIVKMNSRLKEYAERFPNLHIIDWEDFSKNHEEFFAPDGLHLGRAGQKAYAKFIFDSIRDFYFEKSEAEKQNALLEKKAEEERFAKIAALQFEILDFLSKKKNPKNEIISQFIGEERSQDYIESRITELQENTLIAQDKKGVFILTQSGKSELKKMKAAQKSQK